MMTVMEYSRLARHTRVDLNGQMWQVVRRRGGLFGNRFLIIRHGPFRRKMAFSEALDELTVL